MRTEAPAGGSDPGPARIRQLRRTLTRWYAGNARALPWRGVTDPYAVLVSEFMLQQTQVTTVLPYYRAFLDRFPTLEHLARAPEESVRAAWSGLGYYRRARNLQAAAQVLIRDHAGHLPDRLEDLNRLPGVGIYTAAALGSIVHGIPRGVVDGNVIRVLTRVFGIADPAASTRTRDRMQTLADRLIPRRGAGDWNQAMMELGATVCLPRNPRCEACPWRSGCRACAEGTPERYPVKDAAARPVAVERAVGILRKGDAMLLVRRSDDRLLDGTWEFPGLDIPPGRPPARELGRHLESLLDRPVRVGDELARIRHAITHRRLTVRGYDVRTRDLPRAHRERRRWVRAGELEALPVSSMTTKLIRALGTNR